MPQTVAQVGNKRQTRSHWEMFWDRLLQPRDAPEAEMFEKRSMWVMLSAFLSLPTLLVVPSSCDEGFKGGCCPPFQGQLHVPCVRGVPGQVLSKFSL